MTAESELVNLKKLGAAVKMVAEDCGLELRNFAVQPDLEGELNAVTMVLLLDPSNETKPKVQMLQLEAGVGDAMDEALRDRMQAATEKAKKDLSGLELGPKQDLGDIDLDKRLKRRGGFLDE